MHLALTKSFNIIIQINKFIEDYLSNRVAKNRMRTTKIKATNLNFMWNFR